MDKMLYVAMSGAAETWQAQAVHANNLANVSTPGFRSTLAQQLSMPIYGDGLPTRVYSVTQSPGDNFQHGGVNQTGRPLDIAIQGEGWIAVQGKSGQESYTRRGDLRIDPNGNLVNGAGNPVLGQGGAINLPPAEDINITSDGLIFIKPTGAEAGTSLQVDRIKLVTIENKDLVRAEDGLFVSKAGDAASDPEVRISTGSVEMSNVNPVGELIDLIALARKHELDVKLMKTAEENAQASAKLL